MKIYERDALEGGDAFSQGEGNLFANPFRRRGLSIRGKEPSARVSKDFEGGWLGRWLACMPPTLPPPQKGAVRTGRGGNAFSLNSTISCISMDFEVAGQPGGSPP